MIESIQVGEYRVLESGIVTSTEGRDVIFNITSNFSVRVVFTETEDDKQNMKFEVKNETSLVITLQNFNNPLGTEFTKPLVVGTYQTKALYLHLKILGMHQNGNRTIIYTWMQVDKNDEK